MFDEMGALSGEPLRAFAHAVLHDVGFLCLNGIWFFLKQAFRF